MIFERVSDFFRGALRKTGFDLVRYRSMKPILKHHGISLIFDVGANAGQYGHELRKLGYRGRIVSFEPQKQPFATLAEAARRDGNWEAVNIGLGSEEGPETINVHEESRLSSMLAVSQETHVFGAAPIGTEVIEIRRFDSVIDQYAGRDDRILLKIDTQGFEKQVLAGAELSLLRVVGIQIEMSLTPIYAEQPHLDEMIALLRHRGFTLWLIQRGLYDFGTGQELEADGIFIRSEPVKR